MEKSNLDRAYELFKQAARELESSGSVTSHQLRRRLRSVSSRILDLVGGDDDDGQSDVMSTLEAQSRDIAEDLRRVERLMRHQHLEDE